MNPLAKLSRTYFSTISALSSNIRRSGQVRGREVPSFSLIRTLYSPRFSGRPRGRFSNTSINLQYLVGSRALRSTLAVSYSFFRCSRISFIEIVKISVPLYLREHAMQLRVVALIAQISIFLLRVDLRSSVNNTLAAARRFDKRVSKRVFLLVLYKIAVGLKSILIPGLSDLSNSSR